MARTVLDHDLTVIRDSVLRMGLLVDHAVEKAMTSLQSNDVDLARQVIREDDDLDDLHIEIEEQILSTIALQQPAAHDLRFLIAALLISNELERMGDHAEGIAEMTVRYSGDTAVSLLPQIKAMEAAIHRMMQQIMEAYAAQDVKTARAAAGLDAEVDTLYRALFDDVVHSMRKGTGKHPRADEGRLSAEEGTYVLWVGHNLERIGDRVTNIAERIHYAATGSVRDFNPKAEEVRDMPSS